MMTSEDSSAPGPTISEVRADAIGMGDELVDEDGSIWAVTAISVIGINPEHQARAFSTRQRVGMRVKSFVHGDWEQVRRVDAG